MPRSVDPQRHGARRAVIVAAAAAQFAELGYDRATTAGICRAAGISSGTFFHYFPSKLDVLVAVLTTELESLRESLEQVAREASGLAAVLAHAARIEAEMADDSYVTFVNGLLGVVGEPEVAAALAAESEMVERFLAEHLGRGRRDGDVREDVDLADLVTWIGWLVDGASQGALQRPTGAASPLAAAILALVATRPGVLEPD
ncbi:TetR/AcrR family transcriptional regulator [Aeromicrobium sp. HA]|uniref:TetR/AcrR family transcriptional regulator n=1 Tax=Aeromicrobium sp. HA TaxID=3009077 RepID=UPI0022AFD82C|nr:TetR/AcrR family transcriptional regulator [Aeromicrobium sp. HA]